MSKIRTWLFTINLILLCGMGNAQESEPLLESIDTIQKRVKNPYTLRFGIDLIKPVTAQFEKDYFGLELVGDLRLYGDFYIAAEIGNEKRTEQSELINFTTAGSYIKLGFDYNMFKNWKGMNNAIHIGLRLCNSFHSQTVNSYETYNLNHYWPTEITQNGFQTGERESLNARWAEVVVGIKVRLIDNFYMGFSLRMNRLFSDTEPNNFDNLYIPGFNRKTDENVWGAGFNYTLTYAIPIRL